MHIKNVISRYEREIFYAQYSRTALALLQIVEDFSLSIDDKKSKSRIHLGSAF